MKTRLKKGGKGIKSRGDAINNLGGSHIKITRGLMKNVSPHNKHR